MLVSNGNRGVDQETRPDFAVIPFPFVQVFIRQSCLEFPNLVRIIFSHM